MNDTTGPLREMMSPKPMKPKPKQGPGMKLLEQIWGFKNLKVKQIIMASCYGEPDTLVFGD